MNWIYLTFSISILLVLLTKVKISYGLSPAGACSLQTKRKNYNSFFVFLFFLLLTFVVVCREGFVDTADYRQMYSLIGPSVSNAFNNTIGRVEKGFLLIIALLNKISVNSQLLLFFCGIITIFCFGRVIIKSSIDVPFSLILFLCNIWISCMNGMRQILVASVLSLIGYSLISSKISVKKIIVFIICALILTTIHTSVILCMPFYFMAKGKFLNKWVIGFLVGSVLLLLIPPLYNLVLSFVTSGLSYSSMLNTEETMGFSRLLVALAPVILLIIFYFVNNRKIEDKTISWMMNLVVFGFAFSLLSLRMVYFARMRMYFNIFTTISLPYVVHKMFKGNLRMVMTVLILGLYIVTFLYQLNAYGNEISDFHLFFK